MMGEDGDDDETLGLDDSVVVQTPRESMGGNREEHRRQMSTESLSQPLLGDEARGYCRYVVSTVPATDPAV